jgi:hypothetical protein
MVSGCICCGMRKGKSLWNECNVDYLNGRVTQSNGKNRTKIKKRGILLYVKEVSGTFAAC